MKPILLVMVLTVMGCSTPSSKPTPLPSPSPTWTPSLRWEEEGFGDRGDRSEHVKERSREQQ